MLHTGYGSYAALAAVIIVSLLHLFWKKHGNLTKALLLPSILVYYLVSAAKPSVIIIIAICASWLGDVLLEKSGIKWFTAGGISFMLSHLMYTAAYALRTDFGAVKAAIVIPAAAVYIAVTLLTIKAIKPSAPKNLIFPLWLYLFFNASMNTFALMLLTARPCAGSAVIFAGAVLFFISDNCLFIECFHSKKPNLFYPVMGTYIVGEFMIAQGLIMLG